MIRRIGLILVGAGSARRMDGIDKVWERLGTHPIVCHSVARLRSHVEHCVLVVHETHLKQAGNLFRDAEIVIVAGGAERQDSVACGLRALSDVDIVAVHDVARPFASPNIIHDGAKLLDSFDGAIPAIAIADTLKRVDATGTVVTTVDRAELRAVQTPQVFRVDALRQAHAAARDRDARSTDDAQLLEWAGFSVVTFPGESTNFKITTPQDLAIAQYLVSQSPVT